MADLTLFNATKNALDAIGGDEIAAITDTPDALQVAEICKDVYEELSTQTDFPHNYTYGALTTVNDADAPTHISLVANVEHVENIRYDITKAADTHTTYRTLEYKDPEAFLDMVLANRDGNTNIAETNGIGGNGIYLPLRDDKMPQYWTTFDDSYIVCDSYDVAEDVNGLSGDKVIAKIRTVTDFDSTDGTFVIPIPEYMQPLYKARVRAKTFAYIKQISSPQDEREANRQTVRSKHRGRTKVNHPPRTHPKGR